MTEEWIVEATPDYKEVSKLFEESITSTYAMSFCAAEPPAPAVLPIFS